MAPAFLHRSVAGTYPIAGKVGSESPRMNAPRALARAWWIATWTALGMVDGLSVSRRRFWRPARQRRGRCANRAQQSLSHSGTPRLRRCAFCGRGFGLPAVKTRAAYLPRATCN